MGVSFLLTGSVWQWLEWIRADLAGKARGATFKQVSRDDIGELRISLPPLETQRRIAAILDGAEALRAKRRQALRRIDTLAESVFIDLFGDPDHHQAKGGRAVPLGDVAEIVSGITKGRQLNGQTTRSVPYLAVANVQDRTLNLNFVKMIEATEDEIKRYELKVDDLLLTEGGDPDKLGRGTLWKQEITECIHQNHIFRVRLQSSEVQALYVNCLIASRYGKAYFLKSAKQTTGIATINTTQLRNFPLAVPPLSLQREFEAQLQAFIRS